MILWIYHACKGEIEKSVLQWFIYNFGIIGPEIRCFSYQWVQTTNLWVQNTIFHDKSAISLHPGTQWNKNFASQRDLVPNCLQKLSAHNKYGI